MYLRITAQPRYFYRPQRSWGKVIFLEACVKNSVHGGGGGGRGGRAWRGGGIAWWVASVAGGVHGGGEGACMANSQSAGGTHPTGMHSCYHLQTKFGAR